MSPEIPLKQDKIPLLPPGVVFGPYFDAHRATFMDLLGQFDLVESPQDGNPIPFTNREDLVTWAALEMVEHPPLCYSHDQWIGSGFGKARIRIDPSITEMPTLDEIFDRHVLLAKKYPVQYRAYMGKKLETLHRIAQVTPEKIQAQAKSFLSPQEYIDFENQPMDISNSLQEDATRQIAIIQTLLEQSTTIIG